MAEMTDEELLVLLKERGLVEPSDDEIVAEIQARAQAPEPSLFDEVVGGVEGAMTMGSGLASTALGGIYGIASAANPFGEDGAGAQNSAWIQNNFTYQPRTEEGKQAIQQFGDFVAPAVNWLEDKKLELGEGMPGDDPLLATLGHMSPDLILSVLGVPKAVKAPKQPKSVVNRDGIPDQQTQVAEVLQKSSKADDVVNVVEPDPNFYRAVDELGMSEQPLASFGSKNNQFIAIEQGLGSVPGSVIDDVAKKFITELSTKADDMIESFGGYKDKAEFDAVFAENVNNTIKGFAETESKLYTKISELVGLTSRHPAEKTVAFLDEMVARFGGAKELPPNLRKLYNALKPKEMKDGSIQYPTAGKIDFERKQVGQSLEKKRGAYADEEEGLLKTLYGNLAEDMNNIASKAGDEAVAVKTIANQMTVKRKTLEGNQVTLLGRNLDKSLSQEVGTAVKGLANNKVAKFENVLEMIPAGMRQEAVMTALNSVFRGNAVGKQGLDVTQFTKWYQNLNRSPKTKEALFRHMSKDSQRALEGLYKVSSGVSRALGDKVTTGRLNALFNPETGFLRRLTGRALPAIAGYATGTPAGGIMANVTMDFIAQSNNGARRAADMLVSPQFQSIITKAVREGVEQGVKKPSTVLQRQADKFSKSQTYKDWYQSLKESERTALASKGLIAYLFVDEETE